MHTLSLAIAWLWSHHDQLGTVATLVALTWYTLPAATRLAVGRAFPRLAHTLDLAGDLAMNVIAAFGRARKIAAGEPYELPAPPSNSQRGRASLGALVLLALLALFACGPARELTMELAAPAVPERSGCVAGTYRCHEGVPEACSSSGRWWPALPRAADGSQRRCADGCTIGDGGVAYCAPGVR